MTAEEILKKSPTANTEGLTGLAAFIAGETVQRDEEAAVVTRAKVRQAIDVMGREKGIPDTPPAAFIDAMKQQRIPDAVYEAGRTHWAECWRDRSHHNCAVAEIERLRNQLAELGMLRMYKQDADAEIARLRYEYARLHRVLFTVAEYIDNGVRPPAHVDIDGLYAKMRDAVNGWRNGEETHQQEEQEAAYAAMEKKGFLP